MIRLFVEKTLESQALLELSEKPAHYLLHVMRLKVGEDLLLFNGRDGEWKATLETGKKDRASVRIKEKTRLQTPDSDLWLCFAPIKRGHGDFTVEKASELGASKLIPVITQHTVVNRVPVDRYRAIATEAAEQSMRLSVPEVSEGLDLHRLLERWDTKRTLIFCAETGDAKPIAEALRELKPGPLAVLTGPEGGFSEEEFTLIRKKAFVLPVRLGPRILRADTAAIAALSLVQAIRGDWTV
jgi:16S rRNA (uracil1498-N3)-methyltransferase